MSARYLRRDNRVTGFFTPDDAPLRAEIPPAPTVASLLKDFKPRAASLVSEDFEPSQDNIMKRTRLVTAGGVRLALLPKKNRGEAVSVELDLHFGDEKNMFGKGAVPALTGAMLMRGTTKYNRIALADAFDRLRISGSPNRFETTRANLADALRLVAHVLKEPAFPEAEFEQLRQQTLVGIESSRSEPQSLASRALAEHFNIYPHGDPRAETTIEEDIADTRAATLDQLKGLPPRVLRRRAGRDGDRRRLRRRRHPAADR